MKGTAQKPHHSIKHAVRNFSLNLVDSTNDAFLDYAFKFTISSHLHLFLFPGVKSASLKEKKKKKEQKKQRPSSRRSLKNHEKTFAFTDVWLKPATGSCIQRLPSRKTNKNRRALIKILSSFAKKKLNVAIGHEVEWACPCQPREFIARTLFFSPSLFFYTSSFHWTNAKMRVSVDYLLLNNHDSMSIAADVFSIQMTHK